MHYNVLHSTLSHVRILRRVPNKVTKTANLKRNEEMKTGFSQKLKSFLMKFCRFENDVF